MLRGRDAASDLQEQHVRAYVIALLAAAALTLAGCGSPDRDAAASATEMAAADVVVIAEDTTFVDPPRELDAGTLTIGLDNQGRAVHDLTVDGSQGTVVEARGGSQATREVTLEAGTYVLYCSVGGHRQEGMEFEVTVR